MKGKGWGLWSGGSGEGWCGTWGGVQSPGPYPQEEKPDVVTWDSWVVWRFPGGAGKGAPRAPTKLTGPPHEWGWGEEE